MSGPGVASVLTALTMRGTPPQQNGKGWRAPCPAHEDDYLALSIAEGSEAALLACHGVPSCGFESIVAALGLKAAETFDKPRTPKRERGPVTSRVHWSVKDAAGRVVAVHVRLNHADGSKTFVWEQPDGTSGLGELACEDLPLYGIDAVQRGPGSRVVVTEGEKAADALRALGIAAVGTVTGAASAPSLKALADLTGVHVVVWPDNDAIGHKHANTVASRLTEIAASVRLVRWSDAPQKGDAADLAGNGAAVEALLERAELWTPPRNHVTEVTQPDEKMSSVTSVTRFGPLLPLAGEMEPPPFPVKLLPGWFGRWVGAQSEALQCPPDLPAVLGLAVVSTAVAGKRRVMVTEGHYEPLNVYAAVALPSGEKKSPAFRAALEPLRDWEAEERRRIGPGRERAIAREQTLRRALERAQRLAAAGKGTAGAVDEAADALSRHMVPALPQLVVEDVTPDRMGMLLAEQGGRLAQFSDEGAPFQILAGRYSDRGANLELFNKAHTGTAYVCDRVSREGVRVERPTLTVGMAVQPDVIAGLASEKAFRFTGTLARFLFSMPVSRLGERKPDPDPVPAAVRAEYVAGVQALLSLCAPLDEGHEFVAQTLTLDSAAHARLVEFRAALEPRLLPEGDLRGMADWANKAAGAVVRLAGLLHIADRVAEDPGDITVPISLDETERAVQLVEYFLPHAQIAFHLMEATPEMRRLRLLVKWLRRARPNEVTVREVHRALHLEDSEQARRALEALEGRGYVRRVELAEPRAPGRPSELYCVNPAAWPEPAGRDPGREG